MINIQYKSKHESKRASLAVYKQKPQPDGRKSLEASPGLTYKNSSVPRKIEFSTLKVCRAKVRVLTCVPEILNP